MTIIKFLVFNQSVWSDRTLSLCGIFFETMFPTTVSSAESTFQRHIFLQNTESIRIVGREDIWRIRRGNQGVLTEFSESTEMAAGSRSGAYRDLLCGGVSIINGDGR